MSEVRPGYKQTEVGVIPEDWEVKPLGDISCVTMGQSPLGTTYNKNGKGVPLINGPTEFTDRYPIKCQWTWQPTKLCDIGDILLCVRGSSTGRINISNDTYCIGRGIAAIRAKEASDTNYLNSQVHSGIERLLALTTGSTFPNIDGKSLRSIPIPIPPTLAEQTAIAEVLSDTDALIQRLDQLIAKKRNIKQGAMQELLTGKKRLPGFAGEWEKKKVSEVGEIITGSTPPTSNKTYWNGDIPWITPTDISAIRDIWCSERQITQYGLKVLRQLPANTLLVTCIASIGKNSILRKTGACNQQINAVIPDDKHNVDYLYYLIENNKFHLLSRAGITATNIVSKREFMEIVFVFPPTLAEQTAIAAVLSDMDAEIAALERACKIFCVNEKNRYNLFIQNGGLQWQKRNGTLQTQH